jgi:hypothetical protein
MEKLMKMSSEPRMTRGEHGHLACEVPVVWSVIIPPSGEDDAYLGWRRATPDEMAQGLHTWALWDVDWGWIV